MLDWNACCTQYRKVRLKAHGKSPETSPPILNQHYHVPCQTYPPTGYSEINCFLSQKPQTFETPCICFQPCPRTNLRLQPSKVRPFTLCQTSNLYPLGTNNSCTGYYINLGNSWKFLKGSQGELHFYLKMKILKVHIISIFRYSMHITTFEKGTREREKSWAEKTFVRVVLHQSPEIAFPSFIYRLSS